MFESDPMPEEKNAVRVRSEKKKIFTKYIS